MKQVRETSEGRVISAYVILKKGKHIATVNARYGTMTYVDVWSPSTLLYQGRAGGYGYDKYTSALSGAVIDGHKIFNHCGQDEKSKSLLKKFVAATTEIERNKIKIQAEKLGMRFANGYKDLYYTAGIERLTSLGYTIIQAI